MTIMAESILLRHRDIPGLDHIDTYRKNGGFDALRKAITKMDPDDVTNEVKSSGLRGRGGAGFPTGMKWSFIDGNVWPHYVIANADESEPGTFKDREIMEGNPYQFLEGVAICAYAVKANHAYIYLRGEFWQIALKLDQCIKEMEVAGFLGDKLFGSNISIRLHTHLGAGAYICGEESALLDSIEGKLGQPRLRTPFPPAVGVYNKPTIVNNVETLTNVPMIINRGAAWYKSIGTDKSPGPKVFSLSGCVNRPGNYELPLGTTFRELIMDQGRGILGGHKIKAIMAAGASSSLIIANDEALNTSMDYESVPKLGAQLGSASIIVIDDTVSIPWLINKTVRFFKHESCGKCTPCREGTYWMLHLTEHISRGEATMRDVELLRDVANQMKGKCLCALGEFSIEAPLSAIERFPVDFEFITAKSNA
jgi:NADH-quinone oxidoreductase subunit F